ncbi:DUF4844 domain-containing protein [Amniculibacterium aquaticum]|uniref:DUF4844 domain-containing protein n=1 Tax=Amniculibacterium aquaticum TaxID=2479858 RepID=UPI000F5A9157|nr:DUF4844 domain-containing protein [Amniculibacterium aquaticum]
MNISEKLEELQNTKKFSDEKWLQRGLNPSSQEICDYMENFVDNCISEMRKAIHNNKSQNDILKILKSNLKSISKNLDTEEREFMAENFDQISKIVEINLSKDLNKFLYGSTFLTLKKISDLIRGKEKVIETLVSKCTKCEKKLETFILEKMDNSIQNDFNIVRCKNCGELNLIDNESGNKRIKFGEYELVEQLSKETYNLEDAKIRLKQIKIFRK